MRKIIVKLKAEELKKKLKIKDAKVDYDMVINTITERLEKGNVKLKASYIDGYENAESVIRNYAARNYLHGGGDTVKAGSNVTITTDVDGKRVISSTVPLLIATGTIDNVNKAFTFVSKPNVVFVNGLGYQENNGWSWNGGTLTATLDNPVGAGGNIYGI